ncbi:hypothetical protein KKH15_00930 [Patescibacteria group bacterium]|nr:hypothetical protein [Patescibacteria group bacterium]MBU1754803.1 hypothetical protein [Patescibacteria group bacterium]
MNDKRHHNEILSPKPNQNGSSSNSFVLEKGIFSSIFDKDIKRVYIYKKSERLAKAIHLITPAFRSSPALRDRLDRVAVGLVDAGTLPLANAKKELSRELLALSSVLGIARAGGLLSEMNADLISREAHLLLQEVALYEEPRMMLEETSTLAELAKESSARISSAARSSHEGSDKNVHSKGEGKTAPYKGHSDKGQNVIKDIATKAPRTQAILDMLRGNASLSIRDIAAGVRDVSEKTLQRELQKMIDEGVVNKSGERRWTVYSLV